MEFLDLPPELHVKVLQWLAPTELAAASQCCRGLRLIADSDELWRRVCFNKYGWLVPDSVEGGRPPGPAKRWWECAVMLHANRAHFLVVGGHPASGQLGAGHNYRVGVVQAFGLADGHLRNHTTRSDPDPPFTFLTPQPVGSEFRGWTLLEPLGHDVHSPGVVRDADGALIVIGGIGYPERGVGPPRPRATAVVVRCEPHRTEGQAIWHKLPSLLRGRCCAGAVIDRRGAVCVVGGGDTMYANSESTASCEILRRGTDGWKELPKLETPRSAGGVATDLRYDRLFAVGGYAGSNQRVDRLDRYLDNAEMLLLSEGASEARWQSLPVMRSRRAGCTADVGPDGRLFVVGGGSDGIGCFASMEALDPRLANWDSGLAEMTVPRHYHSAAFGPDGRLYVAGTYRPRGQLPTVECYDIRADRWEQLPEMPFATQFTCGAVTFTPFSP